MFPLVPGQTHGVGMFGIYPICYWWVSGGYLQPEPTMYSRCFHWFPGPLTPSDNQSWHQYTANSSLWIAAANCLTVSSNPAIWLWQLLITVCWRLESVRATLPPSMLFADRALLCRGYSISEPNAWGETVSKPLGLTLGLVYNLSRLQLTRWSLHSIAKWEWHRRWCQP